jgi:site-specific recombinase XerD
MKPSRIQINSVRGLRFGPLRPYGQPYITLVQDQGYKLETVRRDLQVIARFNGWLLRTGRKLRDVNEEVAARFLKWHLRRRKRSCGELAILQRFLDVLRKAGMVPPAKAIPLSPAQRLAACYQRYLLEERGCSDQTIGNYTPHVARFLCKYFGAGPINFTELHAREVTGFVRDNGRTQSPQHTKQVVTALRSFLRYLHYTGRIQRDLASTVPSVAHWRLTGLPKHLSPQDVQRVLDHCDQSSAVGQRNYAILLLLARLGLRGGEVIALRLEDIDWDKGNLMIRSRKGRGMAHLPLPTDVGKAIARYLQESRPACACRNVFIRALAPHQALSNSAVISCLVLYALKKAGVFSQRKGAHLFRHSLATTMLSRGASLDEIGQVLRHQDPDSTAIYAKVELKALRQLALPWPGGAR